MQLQFRKAEIYDLDFLVNLEKDAFPVFQQASRRNLKRGIQSSSQEIILALDHVENPIGSIVIYKHRKSIRIYSIALLSHFQKMGFGDQLIDYVLDYAKRHEYERIILEMRAKNEKLLHWYIRLGFEFVKFLPDYYGENEVGIKMQLFLNGDGKRE